MEYQHKNLAGGRWQALTFFEQMANVGSEVERVIKWRNKGNAEYGRLAFERALELLDMTLSGATSASRLKELARVREVLADYFAFENSYGSSDAQWQVYFSAFHFAARKDT